MQRPDVCICLSVHYSNMDFLDEIFEKTTKENLKIVNDGNNVALIRYHFSS